MPSLMSFLSCGHANSLKSPWDQGRLRQIVDGGLVYTLSQHAYHNRIDKKTAGVRNRAHQTQILSRKKKKKALCGAKRNDGKLFMLL